MLTKELFREILEKKDVFIEYKTASGRMMHFTGTLRPDVEKIQLPIANSNPDIIANVWDNSLQKWRAFHWEQLRVFDSEELPNGL